MKTSTLGLSLPFVACVVTALAMAGCPQRPSEVADVTAKADETVPKHGEAGRIEIIGSTTVLPISDAWAQAYHEANPHIEINVSGGGSGNGIKALIDGTTDIGQSSRPIRESEIELARANNVEPVEYIIAFDAMVPIVHPQNPVGSISVEHLSDIYSGAITRWSQVGVVGMDPDRIVVVARDSASGTYESWKELVIQLDGADKDRDYAPAALKMQANKSVSQVVATTPSAIGYIGLGYVDEAVRDVAVVPRGGGEAVEATVACVQDGSFPISRAMYYYTDGRPTDVLAEFLAWATGPKGQAIVAEQGFVPLQ